MKITNLFLGGVVRDIWHKYHSRYFKIVANFTCLTARLITFDNFEISLVVFMRSIILHEKFLQFDWLRAVVFQVNLHERPTCEIYKPFAGSGINR